MSFPFAFFHVLQNSIDSTISCTLFLLLGDQNLLETVANVLTSLPFIVLGIHAPR